MKFKKVIVCFIMLILILTIVYSLYKNDFSNSIYVITLDNNSNVKYYEVNDRKKIREVKSFDSEELEVYTTSSCYNSYIDRVKNKVLNKLTLDECKINKNGEEVAIEGDLEKIIGLVAGLEHDIMKNRILKLEDDYYVVVMLNVNLWTPYEFYKFNKEKNKLELIYTFDGEDVIGIRKILKDKN